MEALHDVVRAGKARYIGASSMYAWQFAKAQHTADLHGWTRFVSMQNHYNLIYREEEREMLPLCLDQGVGVIPWSPLARGRARRQPPARSAPPPAPAATRSPTGMYSDPTTPWSTRCARSPRRAACRSRRSRWPGCCTSRRSRAPIVGATKPGHIEDAVAAVDVELSDEEIAALEAPYVPHPVLGHE